MPRKAPFRVYMERYLDKLRGRSPETVGLYSRTLARVWRTAREVGLTRSPRHWTLEDVQTLLEARRTREDGLARANSTVRNETGLLARFLRSCGNTVLSEALEYGEVRKPPNTLQHRRWHTLEDVIRLRVAARVAGEPTTLLAIQLGLDAYLRVGEMCRLELRDLRPFQVVVRQGKGRKDREVSVTERTRLDVEDYIQGPRAAMVASGDVPWLLVHVHRGRAPRPFQPGSMGHRIRRLGRTIDPPIEVSPHDLRRSGARLTYMANPTDRTVRDLQAALGHSSVEMTREYIGAGVVDQAETMRLRDRWYNQLYPEEFGQS